MKASETRIPMYQKLKLHILDMISSGVLRQGDQLPTETAFCEQFSISRITVRKALADLIKEGVLESHQGKGTFVCNKTVNHRLSRNGVGFTNSCQLNGTRPSSHILQLSFQQATEKDIALLEIPETSKVLYIHRVLYSNEQPVIVERNYFTEDFRKLMSYDLENASIYNILRSDFNIGQIHTSTSIRLSRANEEDARYLDLKPNDPIMYLSEVNYSNNKPIHRTEQSIRGDRYIYEVQSMETLEALKQ